MTIYDKKMSWISSRIPVVYFTFIVTCSQVSTATPGPSNNPTIEPSSASTTAVLTKFTSSSALYAENNVSSSTVTNDSMPLNPTTVLQTISLTPSLSTSIINGTETDGSSGDSNKSSVPVSKTNDNSSSSIEDKTEILQMNSTELIIPATPTSLYVSPEIVPTSVIQTASEPPTDITSPLMTPEIQNATASPTHQLDFSSSLSSDRVTVSIAGSILNTVSIKPTVSSSHSISRTGITDSTQYTSPTASSIVPTATQEISSTSSTANTRKPNKVKANPGGLSTGAKAAIGIIVPVIIIAVIIAGVLYYRRHYKSGQWGMSNSVAYRPWRHSADEESLRFNR